MSVSGHCLSDLRGPCPDPACECACHGTPDLMEALKDSIDRHRSSRRPTPTEETR
jgi:hypothetical protein